MNYTRIICYNLKGKEELDNYSISDLEIQNLKLKYPNSQIAFYVIFGEGVYGFQDSEGSVHKTIVTSDVVDRTFYYTKNNLGNVYDRHLSNQELFLSKDPRTPIGKIVSYFLKKSNVDSKKYIIASAVFDKNIDLEKEFYNASLEGELHTTQNGEIDYIKILDFAVFNDEHEKLYSKAGLVKTIISYIIKENQNKITSGAIHMSNENTERSITFEDVKEFIRRNGIQPSQIFDSNSILGTIHVSENIEFEGGDSQITSILKKKFKDKAFVDKNDYEKMKTSHAYLEKIKPEYEEFKRSKTKNELKNYVSVKAKELGIEENAVKFLSSDSAINDYSDLEFDEKKAVDFIKNKLNVYNDMKRILGGNDEHNKQDNKQDKKWFL